MSKIRAYKLAEELGIDRNDLVEKAAAAGVELKSAMASLDEDMQALLREKLADPKEKKKLVTDRRVERKGRAVIRRRKKTAPEPEPEPIPEPIAAAEPSELEGAPEPSVTAEPEVEPEPTPEPVAEPGDLPAAEPIAASAPRPASGSESAQRERPSAGGTGPSGGTGTGAPADKSGRQRKLVREVVNLREQERLARQATGRGPMRRQVTVDPRTVASPRRKRRDAAAAAPFKQKPAAEVKRVVRVEGQVSVGELARMLGAKAPEVQKKLMALGTMVSINQSIDLATATSVAAEFGFEVQDVGFDEGQFIQEAQTESATFAHRPPIITVMGHVDHGKTSLLDAIRRTKVTEGEAGGITQHIGAYQVSVGGKPLTFIDTPGHAAFTEMRARGAQVTDIVILVVAATEGIMPQTIEAIDHALAAEVPIVVAINKCDLPGANSQQTRQRLMEHKLVPEDFGGEVICVDVSAIKGTGLDKLLEMISLQAELLELKADPKQRATGVVLEARLDRGRGPVATVLVQQGTLEPGQIVVAGTCWGRVRAMEDENGKRVKKAGPSVPVQVIGLNAVPEAGHPMHVVESERVVKDIVAHRESQLRSVPTEARATFTLDEFFAKAEGGGTKELPIVIKGDVQGSVEALRDALLKLSTDAVKVNVLSSGVGGISESDVMLAKASGAIIVAFNVRPDPAARKAAESQQVDVRVYKIIYDVLDEVRAAMVGLLPPTIKETFLGRVEVREIFTVPKIGTIAGSYVSEGAVRRGGNCRLLRDGVQIYEGKVGSLKRFKDDAREVTTGFECGIGIEGYNDLKVGDMIETYVLEEQPATLE